MRTATKRKNAVIPISKDKLKEAIPIMDVARKFSPKLSEKTKLPLILCPFHEDHNLGDPVAFTPQPTPSNVRPAVHTVIC